MDSIINGMRPIHPGEILSEEFLVPLEITAHSLALSLQVPAPRIYEIIHEKRAISVDTALRLSRYFGTSTEFWLGLQTDYDITVMKDKMSDTLLRIQPCKETYA